MFYLVGFRRFRGFGSHRVLGYGLTVLGLGLRKSKLLSLRFAQVTRV